MYGWTHSLLLRMWQSLLSYDFSKTIDMGFFQVMYWWYIVVGLYFINPSRVYKFYTGLVSLQFTHCLGTFITIYFSWYFVCWPVSFPDFLVSEYIILASIWPGSGSVKMLEHHKLFKSNILDKEVLMYYVAIVYTYYAYLELLWNTSLS